MDYKYENDTIVAISTPVGSGGIAVIRLSGIDSIKITDKLFKGQVRLVNAEDRRAYFGRIVDGLSGGQLVDEVVVTVFRAPHSYTREDVVEVSCHGGSYVTQKILELFLQAGARLAEPGEFTKRAFLNGRIDLSQAEAVADIIRAKTEMSLRCSLNQLQGNLSKKIHSFRDKLIDICSFLELELDFVEEDVELLDRRQIYSQIENIQTELRQLIETFKTGKIIREGARVVIAGRPNVGKSSLLNALLKEERAIVTDIPGTTRDSLEEQVDIKGILFQLIDTAGLGSSLDPLEKQARLRAEKQLQTADIILFVFDGSEELKPDDKNILSQWVPKDKGDSRKIICAINKIDLKRQLQPRELAAWVGEAPIVEISARFGFGLELLEETLVNSVLNGNTEQVMVTTVRHHQALIKAEENLQLALNSLAEALSPEFVIVGLRGALDELGQIVGVVTSEDILNNIFSKFCIGK
ncbi:MAG: tRNA uridine-5-carboxymethylaminomethyl(34) synthesis GTPase MnmE [candidate division KSB1 bacterium]|nr:tRNA uridine-5-carboxymethylaminomethyl(34) synthesis GTPase MnmE [candidate division KSB1 bacterium]